MIDLINCPKSLDNNLMGKVSVIIANSFNINYLKYLNNKGHVIIKTKEKININVPHTIYTSLNKNDDYIIEVKKN